MDDNTNKASEPFENYGQPLTFEKVWLMFQETDKMFRETDRKFQETDKKMKELQNLFVTHGENLWKLSLKETLSTF